MNQLLNWTTISKLTQKKIRAYAGVKHNYQLPALLDGNLNIAQSLGEIGQRYNNEIKQKRKEAHRNSQANYVKRKKATDKLKKFKIVDKIREHLKAKKNALFIVLTDYFKDGEIHPVSKVWNIFLWSNWLENGLLLSLGIHLANNCCCCCCNELKSIVFE